MNKVEINIVKQQMFITGIYK